MNAPGKADGNWQWRADAKDFTPALAGEIRELCVRYFRAKPVKKAARKSAGKAE